MRTLVALPGWVLLGVAFAATVYSAWVVSAEPLGPIETTSRLQAESLARDGDFLYEERDRLRFAAKGWPDREAKVMLSLEGDALRYQRPAPYAFALAPFARWAPERGPYLLNLLVLAGLIVALSSRYLRDGCESTPYWIAALLFATPVFAYCRAAWPELWAAALLAGAYLLARDPFSTAGPTKPRASRSKSGAKGKATEKGVESPGLAPHGLRIAGEEVEPPNRRDLAVLAARWLGVGALAALAVLQEPLLAVFLPALVWIAPRNRGEAAWAPMVGGVALVFLMAWFAGGSLFAGSLPGSSEPGLTVRPADSIEDIGHWLERLESAESSGFAVAPRLWFWNLVYTVGGRNVGLVVAFVALLVFAGTGRGRRRGLWLALAAAALLAAVIEPFNFFGGPEALGNRRLLPAIILCFFAVRPRRSLWPALLAGALGALAVSPLWFELGSHPRELRSEWVAAPVAERLPFETSQRYAPVSGEAVSRLLLIRPIGEGIEPGAGKGQFVLRAGRRGELMIAAAGSLAYLDLEFGPGAGSELEVEDGVVENLLFRPDGGVTFRLAPKSALVRHRIWGRDEVHDIHLVEFRMPDRIAQDQPFSVTAQRSDS